MADIKVYFDEDEAAFVRAQQKGYVRTVVRRFMDTDNALTDEDLVYLRDHGGTRGVIAIAKGEKNAGDFEPVTGEVQKSVACRECGARTFGEDLCSACSGVPTPLQKALAKDVTTQDYVGTDGSVHTKRGPSYKMKEDS
jgi:hypothetical protein